MGPIVVVLGLALEHRGEFGALDRLVARLIDDHDGLGILLGRAAVLGLLVALGLVHRLLGRLGPEALVEVAGGDFAGVAVEVAGRVDRVDGHLLLVARTVHAQGAGDDVGVALGEQVGLGEALDGLDLGGFGGGHGVFLRFGSLVRRSASCVPVPSLVFRSLRRFVAGQHGSLSDTLCHCRLA